MAPSKKGIRPLEALEYEDLVEIVRGRSRDKKKNEAYVLIENRIKNKVAYIVRQFYIPGFNRDDVFQEALYALRFKAIPDYDKNRGKRENPYPFDRFALLCIRRHLSTILKGSFQNKKKTLNTSLSLNQDRASSGEDHVFLSDILPKTDGNVMDLMGDKEYHKTLFSKLYKNLSLLEKKVFILYTQKYSYDEITSIINRYYSKNEIRKKTNVKSIDNSLSRIKQKAKDIYIRQNKKNEQDIRDQ